MMNNFWKKAKDSVKRIYIDGDGVSIMVESIDEVTICSTKLAGPFHLFYFWFLFLFDETWIRLVEYARMSYEWNCSCQWHNQCTHRPELKFVEKALINSNENNLVHIIYFIDDLCKMKIVKDINHIAAYACSIRTVRVGPHHVHPYTVSLHFTFYMIWTSTVEQKVNWAPLSRVGDSLQCKNPKHQIEIQFCVGVIALRKRNELILSNELLLLLLCADFK